jgi:hypothetical protein
MLICGQNKSALYGVKSMNVELKQRLINLDSGTLILDLKKLVTDERKLKTDILHYLWVVQQRRIFAEMGFPSLFEFCTKHLGYTEAESQRRISAARLLGELPEIDQKINEGRLSLSSLSMAQSLFRQEAKGYQTFSKDKKIEVIKALENKSVRECEKEILKYSSKKDLFQKREKIKPLSDDFVQISFSAPKAFVEKLEKLKGLRSHKKPGASIYELFNDLLDEVIERKSANQKSSPGSKIQRGVSFAQQVGKPRVQPEALEGFSTLATMPTKSVSTEARRNTWRKYDSHCCYVDPVTKRQCNSKYFLEIDHIKPQALGGDHSEENLKLYCRAHNQLSAIKHFGFDHMDPYING